MNEEIESENVRIHSRADELIACLEGEIAKRDARIVELESRYQRDVYGLNNEGDPIGGEPAGGYANDNARLRAELSDAQAIIDGLRGEVADLRSMLATVSQAGLRVRTERDQQAKRIGELEGLLREVHGWIDESARVYRHNSTSVMLYRIDSALSAGKEG